MSRSPNQRTSFFWVVGHRGSPTALPENTVASFERAVAEGANGLELDLCLTKDGEAVLWHDFDPDESRARLRQWGWNQTCAFDRSRPAAATVSQPVISP